jgi:hypothetical protein
MRMRLWTPHSAVSGGSYQHLHVVRYVLSSVALRPAVAHRTEREPDHAGAAVAQSV